MGGASLGVESVGVVGRGEFVGLGFLGCRYLNILG